MAFYYWAIAALVGALLTTLAIAGLCDAWERRRGGRTMMFNCRRRAGLPVPPTPHRLEGESWRARRTDAGVTLEQAAKALGGTWKMPRLKDIEDGRRTIDPIEASFLLALYNRFSMENRR